MRKHLQASKRPVATSASTLYCAQAMNRVWRFLILGRNKGSVPIVNVVRLTGGRQHRSNLVWRTQDWQDTRRRPASCRLCLKTFQDTAQRRDPGADAAGAGTRGQAAYQLRPGPPPRRLRRAARRPAGPRRARPSRWLDRRTCTGTATACDGWSCGRRRAVLWPLPAHARWDGILERQRFAQKGKCRNDSVEWGKSE